jgi:hypothetical protein
MTTTFKTVVLACSAVMLFSCGSKKDGETNGADSTKKDSVVVKEEAPVMNFGDACKSENAISVVIKDYKYGMKGKYAMETTNFEVKQYKINWMTDSTAEVSLMNYTPEEMKGELKDNQVEIYMYLSTRNGKKLGPGVYNYSSEKGDMAASFKMYTAKGTAYFNWSMGNPDPGNVTLNYISSSGICGTFNMNVDLPKEETIGTVKLNGTFKAGS